MKKYNSIYGVDEICWFENSKDGITLVRPDGSKCSETQSLFRSAPDFYKSKDAVDGWKRAMLFIKAFGIRNSTSFACTMDTVLCYAKKSEGAYLFVTPQSLDRIPAKMLPEDKRKIVSENLDSFYSDSNLQAKMFELILHGMPFYFSGATLEPISMKKANETISKGDSGTIFPVSYISSPKMLREEISSYCNIAFP